MLQLKTVKSSGSDTHLTKNATKSSLSSAQVSENTAEQIWSKSEQSDLIMEQSHTHTHTNKTNHFISCSITEIATFPFLAL